MLNKEQLLETKEYIEQKSKSGCRESKNFTEDDCPAYGKELIETTLKYRDMLERLQFLENTTNIGGAMYRYCPICKSANIQGHKKNCELAKLLK